MAPNPLPIVRPLAGLPGLLLALLPAAAVLAAPSPADARRAAAAARATLDRAAATRPVAFAIEPGRPRRVEASFVFVAAAPKMNVREWVVVGPLPPELPSQARITFAGEPAPAEVREPAGLRRPMLRWRIPHADPSKKLTTLNAQLTLDLVPRKLVPLTAGRGAPDVPPLAAEERAAFTAPSALADFESPALQAWLDASRLRPIPGEDDVDLARRAFLHIKASASFRFREEMDRRASATCSTMAGDCAGLSALFVATMRSAGIPARQLVGRWARTAAKDEQLDGAPWQQDHVKSEFFAAGVGWVPVDISVAVAYDKRPGSLRHFGSDDGDLVTLHVEPDVRVDTVHHGPRVLRFLQSPSFWVTGTGSDAGLVCKSDWHVRSVRGGQGGRQPR